MTLSTATAAGASTQRALTPHRSPLLARVVGVAHGITGRAVGLDDADGNVGYSAPRDADRAWAARRAWCVAVGVDAARLAVVGQVHGAEVVRVGAAEAGRGARPGSGRAGLADALITDEPGVVLMTLHADCLPILLVDPERPAIAAVHAGWRGTVADVAGAAVQAMTAAYGSRPDRLLAHLGPAIGAACYEVGPEVAEAWRSAARDTPGVVAGAAPGEREHFDLVAANRALLGRAGLTEANMEAAGICTRCHGASWFSHRGQGPTTGRFGAVIALTGDDTGGTIPGNGTTPGDGTTHDAR